MFILDDLLFKLPAKGFMGIFKKIAEMAEAELDEEPKLMEKLMQLEFLYETDQITEEEFQEREAEITERLTALQEQKQDDFMLTS